MKLSISTSYSNPIRSFERRLSPSYEEHEFRDPGLPRRGSSRSGLGSLHLGSKKTMPHLAPAVKMQSGGDLVGQLYAERDPATGKLRPNPYNPDPFARRIIGAERTMASQYRNPAWHTMPGSNAAFPYADGGDVDTEDQTPPDPEDLMEPGDQMSSKQADEKQIVVEAMLALEGRHPDAKQALDRFVDTFGAKALAELVSLIRGQGGEGEEEEEEEDNDEQPGEPDEDDQAAAVPAAAGGGLLDGPGSGQSDEIRGTTPTGRPVLLSDGEYVIDAPTVAALGDGSTNAGARRLDALRKQIRTQAYGHGNQAKPMAKGGKAIVVELGA